MRVLSELETELALQYARGIEALTTLNALQADIKDYNIACDEAKLLYDTAVERATLNLANQVTRTMRGLEERIALLKPDSESDDDNDDD